MNPIVPSLDPPMYPTDLPPEQPLQDRVTAPLDKLLLGDSASGVVSAGPRDHELPSTRGIQLTRFV